MRPKPPTVILAGTRSFGAAALAELVVNLDAIVPLVVAPLGDALYNTAKYDLGIDVEPNLHYQDVEEVRPDLIVGAHMHQFIGKKSRAASKFGAVIGHPSLLPRHRGKSSVEWTIKMGDPVAGFTWFVADSGIDTGNIVTQAHCHVVPGWSASDLWRERLFPLGISLLGKAIDLERVVAAVPQDTRVATWEPALENVPSLKRTELDEIADRPHVPLAPRLSLL